MARILLGSDLSFSCALSALYQQETQVCAPHPRPVRHSHGKLSAPQRAQWWARPGVPGPDVTAGPGHFLLTVRTCQLACRASMPLPWRRSAAERAAR